MTTQNGTNTGCQALRLNRPLIEIHEFAKREGISVEDIKHCGKVGILYLRKNKGKTYVVDTPVTSYDNTSQIDNEVAELINHKNKVARSAKIPIMQIKTKTEKAVNVKTFAGKVYSAVRSAANTIKDDVRPKSSAPRHTQTTQTKELDDIPQPRPKRSGIRPGDIKQLVEEMLRKADNIKNQKTNSNVTTKPESQRENTKNLEIQKTKQKLIDIPDQNNKHFAEILNALVSQLDDFEKKMDSRYKIPDSRPKSQP